MIKLYCDKCGEELKELGGLLFSPPKEGREVKKFHLCVECYKDIKRAFKNH